MLKTHFEKAKVFKGTSKTIQNYILDKIIDISLSLQMLIVFQYVSVDGSPIERFWSFYNPTGHDAQSLLECMKPVLQEVIFVNQKLIIQSYDGANVMSVEIKGLQSLIKSKYPNTYYVMLIN